MIKNCVVCGGEFEARRRGHKYCSKACWRKRETEAQRKLRAIKRTLRSCIVCRCTFYPRGPKKTCSIECRRQMKNRRKHLPKRAKACVLCGTQFEVSGKAPKKTCSKTCHVRWKRSIAASRHERTYTPANTIKQCVVCGADFRCVTNKMTCGKPCATARTRAIQRAYYKAHPEYGRAASARRAAALRLVRELQSKGLEALL